VVTFGAGDVDRDAAVDDVAVVEALRASVESCARHREKQGEGCVVGHCEIEADKANEIVDVKATSLFDVELGKASYSFMHDITQRQEIQAK
jgi:hypothetical protein